MARPIWKGHISFGLVNIPVNLYSAEQRSDIRFHMLDSRNQARVHFERINEETGEEVPWNEVVRAYEFSEDNYVVLDEEDLKRAVPQGSKNLEIEAFVELDDIGYQYFERPYILVPDKQGIKSYVLLREALKRENKVGIAKVMIRTKQYLAAVMPCGDALMLNLMRFKQELKDLRQFDLPRGSARQFHIAEKELQMAEQLIHAMSDEWKPEAYHDDYREALMQWIAEKAKGQIHKAPEPEEIPSGDVVDLMSLMRQSLAKKEPKKPSRKPVSKREKMRV